MALEAPPAVGPIAPASEIKDDADERRAARGAGTRLIAMYLDEYHVSAGESTERVRAAVSRFIDEQVRPGDLLAVMKPLDHLTEIRFTRDRDAARGRPSAASTGGATTTRRARRSRSSISADRLVRCAPRGRRS